MVPPVATLPTGSVTKCPFPLAARGGLFPCCTVSAPPSTGANRAQAGKQRNRGSGRSGTGSEPSLQQRQAAAAPLEASPETHTSGRLLLRRLGGPGTKDAPLLVYLPGADGTGMAIMPQLRGLVELGFEVRALQIPADDRSDWQGLTDATVALLAAALAPTPGRAACVLAESFGGCLALRVAAQGPGLVGSLALVNPATCFARSYGGLPSLVAATGLLGAFPRELYQVAQAVLMPMLVDRRLVSPASTEALLRMTNMAPDGGDAPQPAGARGGGWSAHLPAAAAAHRLQLLREGGVSDALLASVRVPTLVIASSEDRMLPTLSEAARLVAAMPCASRVVLPGSSHSALLESGVDLARLLRKARFLPAALLRGRGDATAPANTRAASGERGGGGGGGSNGGNGNGAAAALAAAQPVVLAAVAGAGVAAAPPAPARPVVVAAAAGGAPAAVGRVVTLERGGGVAALVPGGRLVVQEAEAEADAEAEAGVLLVEEQGEPAGVATVEARGAAADGGGGGEAAPGPASEPGVDSGAAAPDSPSEGSSSGGSGGGSSGSGEGGGEGSGGASAHDAASAAEAAMVQLLLEALEQDMSAVEGGETLVAQCSVDQRPGQMVDTRKGPVSIPNLQRWAEESTKTTFSPDPKPPTPPPGPGAPPPAPPAADAHASTASMDVANRANGVAIPDVAAALILDSNSGPDAAPNVAADPSVAAAPRSEGASQGAGGGGGGGGGGVAGRVYAGGRVERAVVDESYEAALELLAPWRALVSPVVRGEELLPRGEQRDRPIVFVGNHTLYGLYDMPLLLMELYIRGFKARGLAHALHWRGPLGGLFERFGAVKVSPRAMFRLLKDNQSLLLFPGGAREVNKRRGERYQLFWREEVDFVRLAAKCGAIIVPFAAVGGDDAYEVAMDTDEILAAPVVGPLLRALVDRFVLSGAGGGNAEEAVLPLAYLPPPLPRLPTPLPLPNLQRVYFKFMAPIDTREAVPNVRDAVACAEAYRQVQAQVQAGMAALQEEQAADPLRSVGPRLSDSLQRFQPAVDLLRPRK